MKTDDKPSVPEDIATCLKDLARDLWSGHATVMIGAGFSRNARKTDPSAPDFPNWHELGDYFYEKLHDQKPDGKTHHYLSPLKLADEVRAAFGDEALDQLLRARIPDTEHEPSDLHIRLMEFPWVDVLTTNYDTLLERTPSRRASRRYRVVVSENDLAHSTHPWIVKLHGSLAPRTPLVISEEDYRQYPSKHEVFVNTVRQSLVENTFCLIGFSGDDPNFLEWIGWVRDRLGAGSPRMYLVGLPSLTLVERRLPQERGIALLDLAQLPGVDGDHGKAFSAFFDYLLGARPVALLDWPRGMAVGGAPKPKTAEELRDRWRGERDSYPNWVIAPKSSREWLWHSLRFDDFGRRVVGATEQTPPPLDISLLYELDWRFAQALCPLPNELLPHYQRILGRYAPFPQSASSEGADVTPQHGQHARLDWTALGAQWLDLNLSLLRFYREEGMAEKWAETSGRLDALKDHLSPEQVARWSYERCLSALFAMDLAATRAEIRSWPPNATLPLWEAKRAGMMAELGEIADAEQVLEDALSTVRLKQHPSSMAGDLRWLSQEGHVMHLLYLVKMARTWAERQQTADERLREEYRDRWSELKQYGCDPWADMELFDGRLKVSWAGPHAVTRNRQFDVGREAITHHLGSGDDGPLLGYAFLRYCEEVGLPFALPSLSIATSQAKNAVARIAESSPAWAIVTMLRVGDGNVADSLFSRNALTHMSVTRIDEHVDHFAAVLRAAQPAITQGDRFRRRDLGIRIAHVIPEVLSRLCTKCSLGRTKEVLKLLRELYESPTPLSYDGVDHLAMRLLGSMPALQQRDLLPELLEFPLLQEAHPVALQSFPEPFQFVHASRRGVSDARSVPPDRRAVDGLLEKVASRDAEERSRACLRAEALRVLGLLDEDQATEFGRALWDKVGQHGLPARTPFYKWAFLELPHPPGIDPGSLFRSYVAGFSFDSVDAGAGGVHVSESGKRSVRITRGEIPFCRDILAATKRRDGSGFINWSTVETLVLLGKLMAWWDTGKDRLREGGVSSGFGDVSGEFRARYRNLVQILVEVVAPRLMAELDAEVKDRLKGLLGELDHCGQAALRAHAACIPVFPEGKESVLERVGEAMAMGDRARMVDGLEAACDLAVMDSMEAEPGIQHLVCAVAQQIRWRRGVSLRSCLTVMQVVAEKAPKRLTDDVTADILAGLQHLLQESDPRSAGPEADVDDRLNHRVGAAALAHSLYDSSVKAGIAPPAVLLEWQRVCADPEEFAEIRNRWEP